MSSKQRREAALAAARDTVRPEPAPSGEGWPLALIARTRALWESLEGRYGFWDHGFEVFASPVPPGASLVIVGEHPVGGADAFDLARASVVPARHATWMPQGSDSHACRRRSALSGTRPR